MHSDNPQQQRKKSVPMEQERPARLAIQHGGSSRSAGQVDAGSSSTATRAATRPEPGTHDDEMDTEEPCATHERRVRTDLGPNSSADLDEAASENDDVPPEVTHELNRLKALGRLYQAPSVDELMPERDVYGTKSNELLDPAIGGRRPCGAAPRSYEASSSRTCMVSS